MNNIVIRVVRFRSDCGGGGEGGRGRPCQRDPESRTLPASLWPVTSLYQFNRFQHDTRPCHCSSPTFTANYFHLVPAP